MIGSRVHLAPPLLALPCLFTLMIPLPGLLWLPGLVHLWVRGVGLVMPPPIWFRLMSWLVALFLMPCHLHPLMQSCLQMMLLRPQTRRLQQ